MSRQGASADPTCKTPLAQVWATNSGGNPRVNSMDTTNVPLHPCILTNTGAVLPLVAAGAYTRVAGARRRNILALAG